VFTLPSIPFSKNKYQEMSSLCKNRTFLIGTKNQLLKNVIKYCASLDQVCLRTVSKMFKEMVLQACPFRIRIRMVYFHCKNVFTLKKNN
jgi:hypothetical protein